jgi:type II secretory ATPase GspE/PulE/Tfp pilus assembly ATPase PilB-like protein
VADVNLPQDGRMRWKRSDKDYDLRVSSVPFIFGESLVVRILVQSAWLPGLDKLGFYEDQAEQIRGWIRQPSGAILVTGPTGAGKTTTLYSMLLAINSPEHKIMTIEDPVEYVITGVNHAQVNKKAGYTFAAAIRSFFRHDPDVIMAGGMRDFESISLLIQAAITGHLVLSNLHTNDAIRAISRLTEVGVEPFMVAASVLGIISQRLVRMVCPDCKQEASLDVESPAARFFGITADDLAGAKLVRGEGCDNCRKTGYKNRAGIYEVLTIDRDLASMISNGATAEEMLGAAKAKGFLTMRDDAKRKILNDLTTPEEAMRVLV